MSRSTSFAAGIVLAVSLALPALGSASPRIADGTEIFKGSISPAGSIRFQALPSKRNPAPRLDRFRLKFDCGDGSGMTGVGSGAAPGSPIRPNSKGRFRIYDKYSDLTFDLKGKFNTRFTRASGTFSFQGNVGDGVHTDCDTGKLTWEARVQP